MNVMFRCIIKSKSAFRQNNRMVEFCKSLYTILGRNSIINKFAFKMFDSMIFGFARTTTTNDCYREFYIFFSHFLRIIKYNRLCSYAMCLISKQEHFKLGKLYIICMIIRHKAFCCQQNQLYMFMMFRC